MLDLCQSVTAVPVATLMHHSPARLILTSGNGFEAEGKHRARAFVSRMWL